jgi:hypothetical protein
MSGFQTERWHQTWGKRSAFETGRFLGEGSMGKAVDLRIDEQCDVCLHWAAGTRADGEARRLRGKKGHL